MASVTPCRRINRATNAFPIPENDTAFSLPSAFDALGKTHDMAAFLDDVTTTGLMVLHKGEKVYENYWHGNRADTQVAIFSCTKSFVSTLVACALRDGHIASVDDTADTYAPELKGSGYEGVRIEDILQMSSGVRWNEDYGDPNSDIARFAAAYLEPASFDAVCASLPREHEPGTYNRYNTCDTHVLGMIVSRAVGMSLTDYLQQQVWDVLGMEDDSFILVDGEGVEAAGMGLQVTLRDMAKLGQLMLRGGISPDGAKLLPDGWIAHCATASKPHLMPGKRPNASYPWGYGYQWWIPDETGVFTALGVYHQMIWVDQDRDVVIAKTTAYPEFGQDHDDEDRVDALHFAACHAIAAAAAGQ
ncbi:serine hydrolase [Erythrobacter sp. GH3-10]|uniref:Serine hydrolase n=2 Tax=Aurantiacibacter rhizosphaerae TaxID=2691582 RepID=A0A844XI76_9SPHN|nr:serine hydrolase [Aurantiacibacter rhizosphaerae]